MLYDHLAVLDLDLAAHFFTGAARGGGSVFRGNTRSGKAGHRGR